MKASDSGTRKLHVNIGGLSCSFCAESIRKAYGRMEGVREVNVSLSHEEALIEYEPSAVGEEALKETLRDLGYTVREPDRVRTFEEEEAELAAAKRKLLVASALTAFSLSLMVAMWIGEMRPWFRWPAMGLALATVFGPGWYILKKAGQALRRGILNQHVLLEFGAFAGLFGGFVGFVLPAFPTVDFFAVAVFVTTYHVLSEYTSLKVRTRASRAVRKLLALRPARARLVRDGREEEIPVDEVKKGDRVRVRPGESIPVDGKVVEGASEVDESLVTGESMPIGKEAGDEAIGGSVNQSGTLLLEVTKVGEESFLQQVASHIREARALKPGVVQVVDRILKFYVPGVVGFAGLGVLVWTAGAWAVAGDPDIPRAMFSALAVLVMGYPCALGMATPLALIRGGGMAAQKGILMRSGEAFQVMRAIRKAVLDKTGTITKGQPEVTDVVPLGPAFEETDVLRLAAAVEVASEHPLGRAIVARGEADGLQVPEADAFQAAAGKGVSAKVDGERVLVGSLRFLGEGGVDVSCAEGEAEKLRQRGRTVVGVAREGVPVGLIGIADGIKEDAREAVEGLRRIGIEPVMITGDNRRTAEAVAGQVGIKRVMAGVLPEEKAAEVRRLQAEGSRVAMVGDGINDAPALMQADVGMAIGAGTDIAIEAADVVLMGGRLGAVVDTFHIGRRSYRKTVQNLALAFSFNGIGVPAAVTGLVHPVWAMIAMVASVSSVLLNSFGGRLLPARRKGNASLKVRLRVPGMRCEGCVRTIKDALQKAAAERVEVEGDLETKQLYVALYGDDMTEDGVVKVLTEGGYSPEKLRPAGDRLSAQPGDRVPK